MGTYGSGLRGVTRSARAELGAGQAIGMIFVLLFIVVGVGTFLVFQNSRSSAHKVAEALRAVTSANIPLLTTLADGRTVPISNVSDALGSLAERVGQNAEATVCAAVFDSSGLLAGPFKRVGVMCTNPPSSVQAAAQNSQAASPNQVSTYVVVVYQESDPALLVAVDAAVEATGGAATNSGAPSGPIGPANTPTPTPSGSPPATPTSNPSPAPSPEPTASPTPGALPTETHGSSNQAPGLSTGEGPGSSPPSPEAPPAADGTISW